MLRIHKLLVLRRGKYKYLCTFKLKLNFLSKTHCSQISYCVNVLDKDTINKYIICEDLKKIIKKQFLFCIELTEQALLAIKYIL